VLKAAEQAAALAASPKAPGAAAPAVQAAAPAPRARSPLAPLLPSALSPYAGVIERVLLVLLGLLLGFLLGGRAGR
jgi:hypothetical protein